MKTAAVIGSGAVGTALSDGLLAKGYRVVRGTREPSKLASWKEKAGSAASVGTFDEAARAGDLVVLAVKGVAAEAALELCGAGALEGKIVIDTTNPIAEAPPTKGVLSFFTGPNESLFERLQGRAKGARFVKAFSSVGSALMVNPDFGGVRPTMFICGDDEAAKGDVGALLDRFGWDSADMGGAEAARAIEPLCMLWCIPGLLRNEWSHAFHVLKK